MNSAAHRFPTAMRSDEEGRISPKNPAKGSVAVKGEHRLVICCDIKREDGRISFEKRPVIFTAGGFTLTYGTQRFAHFCYLDFTFGSLRQISMISDVGWVRCGDTSCRKGIYSTQLDQ